MPINIEKKKRRYYPDDFNAQEWSPVEEALRELSAAEISSPEDLVRLIEKRSELSDILEETGAWKYIRMTQHADDATLAKAQADFYEQVTAPSHPYFFEVNKKICESNFFGALPAERFAHLGRLLRNDIEIYRKENIPLFVKENELVNRYGEMYSKLTVIFEGQEKTLSEMGLVQKDPERDRREAAWRLVSAKMLEVKDDFEKLFDELKALRIEIAKNAGFENYRDYMHKALGRFDYTPEDLFEFHQAIERVVIPVIKKIDEERREKLGVDSLRPWDMEVDLDGKVLRPFEDTDRLLGGTVNMLRRVDPDFADVLTALSDNGFLDLANRKGKAPGGYNYPLAESGASFIFMNAVGLPYDVDTLTHETGHGCHAFFRREERISEYKDAPKEVDELSSMSMELIASDYYGEFYTDLQDLKKARRDLFEGAISILPMVAAVDAFQHWIYLHPECTAVERGAEFSRIKDRFGSIVDWTGLEEEKSNGWLRVLHIFEVPFYYVEYAISQLGAFAIYKEYESDHEQAIANYKKFLKLGYSKPMPDVYAAAGIKFDFSKAYLEEMVDFIAKELD